MLWANCAVPKKGRLCVVKVQRRTAPEPRSPPRRRAAGSDKHAKERRRPKAATAAVMPPTVDQMHDSFYSIFRTGNRNAASHLWASWILDRATEMDQARLEELFSAFCPISGSPIRAPSAQNRYLYSLPSVTAHPDAVGFVNHCCTPCVCDTFDLVHADTKTIELSGGNAHTFTFTVIGDACVHPDALNARFDDPHSGSTSLAIRAPELTCTDSGRLHGATFSDHGGVIIGLLAESPPLGAAPQAPTPGRITTSDGISFQDAREYTAQCEERARAGYASGMGMIFRQAALIAPLPGNATLVPPLPPLAPPAPPQPQAPPGRPETLLSSGVLIALCVLAAAIGLLLCLCAADALLRGLRRSRRREAPMTKTFASEVSEVEATPATMQRM